MNLFLIRVFNKLKLLSYLNITAITRVNNRKIRIPILKKNGLSNLRISEPWMIEVLDVILPIDNHTFIDVGVNNGQTLIKLRSVSSEIKYIGFEPNPMCINYTYHLVEENNFNNVSIIPVGISDKTELGILNFFNSSTTNSSATMISNFRPQETIKRKEYIPLFTLTSITKTIDFDVISILKIDVEGAELEVLDSFYFSIKKHNPIILIEILPSYNERNLFRLERQNKIQKMLLEAQYSMFRVIKQKGVLKGLEEITKIGIHSDLNKCEYVMVPNTKKMQFENCWRQKKQVVFNTIS